MSFVFLVNIIALLFTLFVAGALLGVLFSPTFREKVAALLHLEHLLLAKSSWNPILIPGLTYWTAEAVMNPAAIVLDGKTYLVYRAIGADGVSRLGYAVSDDGISFHHHPLTLAFAAQEPRRNTGLRRYSPVMYPSGGSWGGTEDPRMVLIDGTIYITFNMFDGWDYIRVAAISISKDDFVAGRFDRWNGPVLLSRPGEIQKNWVIFPEKINGKFAILHSISPKIEIAYRDHIEDIGTKEPLIKSWVGARGGLPARKGAWDSRVRSAGPPPLKTSHGWLLFYHANDDREPSKYKLGAMLLDLNDPTKILRRASLPVLSPDAPYENDGKPGIVYACGATVQEDTLYIYYGGADKVVAVATAPLDTFLDALIKDEQPKLAR